VIDKDLLAILACPQSHQGLREVCADSLARVNERVARGELKNVGDTLVSEALEGGRLREDGAILYPIRDRIPVLLVEEGLDVRELGLEG